MLFDLDFQYEVQRELNRQRVQDAEKNRLLREMFRQDKRSPGQWLRSLLFFL